MARLGERWVGGFRWRSPRRPHTLSMHPNVSPSQSASRQGCLIGKSRLTNGGAGGYDAGPVESILGIFIVVGSYGLCCDVDSAVRSGGDQGRLVVGSAGERG